MADRTQVVDPPEANVGGWRVTVSPRVVNVDARGRAGNAHETLGPHTGFEALCQAVLTCPPGRRLAGATGSAEEVLFVLAGRGTVLIDGTHHELEAENALYLAPGEEYELQSEADKALRLVRVTIPRPERPERPQQPAQPERPQRPVVRRLADLQAQDATTDREFRVLADPSSGLRSATHFVGYIPVARAPEHFHTYDEVIYVLDGEGIFHSGELHEPLGPGSCIQLPARTVHCLENTGDAVMRVVAVFRPAGSPAAAYYPDGTPAYTTDSNR
jgi:quercetin dioxygenase-like cupin family protein